MKYSPDIHHRKSIRLKGFDYSLAGLYFVTICTKNRLHLFGQIIDDVMILNDVGKITKQCWLDIPKHYPGIKSPEFVVMPNHVHGIIQIVGVQDFEPQRNQYQKIIPRSIGSIVRGFKIGATKWFRQNTVGVQNFEPLHEPIEPLHEPIEPPTVWQRNYHEHIIRNEKSYFHISEYIRTNPVKWPDDIYCRGSKS